MRLHRVFLLALTLALTLVLGACAQTGPHPQALAGLSEARQTSGFAHAYSNTEQPLGKVLGNAQSRASRIFIAPTRVNFSDYWLREYRSDYSQRDLDRLSQQYAGLLDKALRSALEKSGNYLLVGTLNEADIHLQPTLDALNIYAPDLSFQGNTRQYIHEAGNATLNLVIGDAKSGAPLAQLIDNRETSSNPSLRVERADRITNARYFSRLMDRWGNNLVKYLDAH